MKIFSTETLLNQCKVKESIIVKSFQEYKDLGGKLDILDAYSLTKERAKKYEGNYISLMDMACSGIEVSEDNIRRNRLLAQVFWTILHMWFNKPRNKK